MLPQASHSGAADWASAVADACLAVGTPAFGAALLHAANAAAPVDRCVIVPFHRQVPSHDLLIVGEGDLQTTARVLDDYVTDGYLDDPNISYARAGKPRPVFPPFCPEAYKDRFRARFIERQGMIDDVPCLAGNGDRVMYCNFVRLAPNSRYTEHERMVFHRVIPILANLAAIHRTLCGPFSRGQQAGQIRTPEEEVQLLAQRLWRSPFDALTERERAVCFRIMLGYSSEAIGLHLGVARTTIMTYRKRAYEKLGIVSHYELFSLYIHSLPGSTPESN